MAETKLNQIIAVTKTRQAEGERQWTDIYHTFQKGELFTGFFKDYAPLQENGQVRPPEVKLVKFKVDDLLAEMQNVCATMFDLVATRDRTNQDAKADVVVSGQTILRDVPATTLIYLNNQLDHLHEVVTAIPVLDSGEEWDFDRTTGLMKAKHESWSIREEKRKKALVLYPATDKHPAQTQPIEELEAVGKWTTTKYAGGIYLTELKRILSKVDTLRTAVKMALEQANMAPVVQMNVGQPIMTFIFAGSAE